MKSVMKTGAALLAAAVSNPSFSAEIVEIEEIIVVGQKMQRSLQDTKDSVLVMTQNTLENRGVMDLQQALALTPGASGNGRNSLAGAIAIKTVDPQYENNGLLRVGLADFGGREVSGVANINLANGASALRISGDWRESDG